MSHRSPPQVSVVVPAYNAARYLGEAIASVLAQPHRPLDVVIVDDGSTDETAEVAAGFGPEVRVLRQENAGTAAARNRGLASCRGEVVAHLDADDLWPADRLELLLETLESTPEADAVSGSVQSFFSAELGADERRGVVFHEQPMPGNVVVSMLIRRRAAERVGAFDPRWRVGADMDWMLRAREAGLRIESIPQVVLLRRLHRSNKGRVERERFGDRLLILKTALDRRRGSDGGAGPTATGAEEPEEADG